MKSDTAMKTVIALSFVISTLAWAVVPLSLDRKTPLPNGVGGDPYAATVLIVAETRPTPARFRTGNSLLD